MSEPCHLFPMLCEHCFPEHGSYELHSRSKRRIVRWPRNSWFRSFHPDQFHCCVNQRAQMGCSLSLVCILCNCWRQVVLALLGHYSRSWSNCQFVSGSNSWCWFWPLKVLYGLGPGGLRDCLSLYNPACPLWSIMTRCCYLWRWERRWQ